MPDSDFAALIPVYNGAGTMEEVVRGAARHLGRIIVVDDGSTDATPEILRRFSDIEVLTHMENRKKGAALQTGIRHARKEGIRCVVTLDADMQHDPDDIPRFIDAYRAGLGSIIIGSRFLALPQEGAPGPGISPLARPRRHRPPEMPRVRYLSNTISSFLISRFVGAPPGSRFGDIQSGYRLYETDILERIPLEEVGFNFETEIVVKAVRLGIPVGEIPIRCLYPEGVARSHYRTFHDSWQIARVALAARRIRRK